MVNAAPGDFWGELNHGFARMTRIARIGKGWARGPPNEFAAHGFLTTDYRILWITRMGRDGIGMRAMAVRLSEEPLLLSGSSAAQVRGKNAGESRGARVASIKKDTGGVKKRGYFDA
jgi:hypothetical protein